jgi:chorismate dehydratase
LKESRVTPVVRLGGLAYRNAEPLQRGLQPEPQLFTSADAAAAFASGKLDVALIPWVAAIASGWENFVVPGTGIAAEGPVHSVFVAWPAGSPLRGPVQADPTSRSSAALFEILRCSFNFFGPDMPPLEPPIEDSPADQARLMIGDRAISFRQNAASSWQFLDLSEAWFSCTGLPFVFAVWVAKSRISFWQDKLAEVRDRNLSTILDWTRSWEDHEFWLRYYSGLRYRLGPREEEAMALFHKHFQSSFPG